MIYYIIQRTYKYIVRFGYIVYECDRICTSYRWVLIKILFYNWYYEHLSYNPIDIWRLLSWRCHISILVILMFIFTWHISHHNKGHTLLQCNYTYSLFTVVITEKRVLEQFISNNYILKLY